MKQEFFSGLMVDRDERTPVVEVRKSQSVRLLDIFVLGPAMIYLATRARPLSAQERTLLLVTGVGTVAYNWSNWNETRKANKPDAEPVS